VWKSARYIIDDPESQYVGGNGKGREDKISLTDIAIAAPGKFYVLEKDFRGSIDAAIKKIYEIDLRDYNFVEDEILPKKLYYDLVPDILSTNGQVLEKIEGLTVNEDGKVWFMSDNDAVRENELGEQLLRPIEGSGFPLDPCEEFNCKQCFNKGKGDKEKCSLYAVDDNDFSCISRNRCGNLGYDIGTCYERSQIQKPNGIGSTKACRKIKKGQSPLPCNLEDDETFLYTNNNGKEKNCAEYLSRKADEKCPTLIDGKFVYDWCPRTCDEKAGIGPCQNK